MPIPPHTRQGTLPPFTGVDVSSAVRTSPYEVTTVELVSRFATSPARIGMLTGLLAYRDALRAFGLRDGFQWIDGSFVERLDREPGDVDIVTFASRPAAYDPAGRWLFDPMATKERFSCDAYFVDLSMNNSAHLVERTTYFYGVFSHRKPSLLWKGMLHVDLTSIAGDAQARTLLDRLRVTRGAS